MTFRESIRHRGRGVVPFHDHDGSDISGEIVASVIKVEHLLGGTITGEEFIIAGGVDGIIRSDNFVAGSAGWIFRGNGSGEINDLVVRGDIESGNWDGASPANLATVDTGATAGFYLDSSVGALQLEGNLFLNGDLTVDNAAGDRSLQLSPTAAGATQLGIAWRTEVGGGGSISASIYTSDAAEPDLRIEASSDLELWGANFTRMGFNGTWPMQTTTNVGDGSNDQALILNGTAAIPSFAFASDLDTGFFHSSTNRIGLSTAGVERIQIRTDFWIAAPAITTGPAAIKIDGAGTAAAPAFTFGNDIDSGIFRVGADQVGIATGGTQRLVVAAKRFDIVNTDFLKLPVKTTTGDPAAPTDGDIYVNTSDKLLRLRANSAWQTVHSW